MKAASFDYVRPTSLDEALRVLAGHGDTAKILAGGQSLVPVLNMRLAAPDLLVDIGRLEELRGLSVERDTLRIGALIRHHELASSEQVARHAPLLARAAPFIAHEAIRSRGTIGGSLALADPAAELPACMLALDAMILVTGPGGERKIPARSFFKGVYETDLAEGEILIGVEVPVAREHERFAFDELTRRSGDYAMAGLCGRALVAGDGVSGLRLAYFGVSDRPVLVEAAAAALENRRWDDAALREGEAALETELETFEDVHTSAKAKLHLAKVLLKRVTKMLQEGEAVA